MYQEAREVIKFWPHDVSRFVSSHVLQRHLTLDSKLFFADDSKTSNGRKMIYGYGISHVTIQEFEKYRQPNGSLQKNLEWDFVPNFESTQNNLTVHIAELYAKMGNDIGAIIVCNLFDTQQMKKSLEEKRVPYVSEISEILLPTGGLFLRQNGKRSLASPENQPRDYLYKQRVGDLTKEAMKNELGNGLKRRN